MGEPYRLEPVVVMLDVYRRSVVAVGRTVEGAKVAARDLGRRAGGRIAAVARRLCRSDGEIMPSMIGERLRAAKRERAAPPPPSGGRVIRR
jgi:hypothetical protein